MIGKTISHYTILEKLGEGGMGLVYKAEDTRLKRTIVLKFLPPELTRDEEAKKRFVNEAQAASALDHPNICTIHEIDENKEDQMFIAMSYYEGETLKQKVAGGKLQVAEVIDIATQIAEGLAKAHKHGIVHRDVKPGNVVLTNDRLIKIIDFGLAKLTGTKNITKTSSTMGTVSYMSPEQVEGKIVDHRTDIWSLGVLLYEMLTGELPFKGETEPPVIYSILNEEPEPILRIRADLPLALDEIVQKALQKDRSERYQHVDELIADLQLLERDSASREILSKFRAIKIAAPKRPHASIVPGIAIVTAVLMMLSYFYSIKQQEEIRERIPVAVVDVVNDTKEEELDGLSGMLITALEQSRRLSVLTRSRMFDLLKQLGKENVESINEALGREICRRTNVRVLLKATVRKLGKVYSIELQAIDPFKDEYLFAARESGQGQESIFGMIDAVSEKIRKKLDEKHSEIQATSQKIAEVTTINLAAYQHYFQAEKLIHELKFLQAEEELQKAIALDTTFGLAYYQLSYVNRWRYYSEGLDERENRQNEMLQKAIKWLDHIPPKEQYFVRAQQVLLKMGGPAGDEGAIAILKKMEQIYPDEKEMLYLIGDLKYHLTNFTAAREYLEKVLKLDPSHGRALQHLVRTYSDIGDYQKMFEVAQLYRLVNENEGNYYLGEYYYHIGEIKTALSHIERYLATASKGWTFTRAIEFVEQIYGKPGRYEEMLEFARRASSYVLYKITAAGFIRSYKYLKAEQVLLEAKQRFPENHAPYWYLAHFYPYLGKYRKALEIFDEFLALCQQSNDTTKVTDVLIYKALFCIWGWNDFQKAVIELEKALQYEEHIPYWRNVVVFHIYNGDFSLAEKLTLQKEKSAQSQQFIRLLIHSRKQECAEAQEIEKNLSQFIPEHMRVWALYPLAMCQFEMGDLEAAQSSLLQLQGYTDTAGGFLAVYYPKSYYLLGKIYEQQGDTQRAIHNYRKLLQLWQEADEDLPELIDAKARLANLSGA